MVDISPANSPTRSQLSEVVVSLRQEIGAMAEQRKEISLLIKQTAGEIDHLTQLNRDQSSQMRQLQANIDAYPHAKIQQRYSVWQEAQMRLFMQQNQLEQLRNRQANLERSEQMAAGLLGVVDSLMGGVEAGTAAAIGSAAAGEGSGPGGQDQVSGLIRAMELVYHRLSRELQDGSSQVLSDLILRAEICERLVDRDTDMAKEELSLLRQATSQALKSTRRLIQELEPPSLEELGVATALRRYLSAVLPGEGVSVQLEIGGKERRLPQSVEFGLFRILQEALSNAVQHSRAENIQLALQFEGERVTGRVSDDGAGFDPAAALRQAATGVRSGLTEMQLRADLIGASMQISSHPGEGCTVSITLPA